MSHCDCDSHHPALMPMEAALEHLLAAARPVGEQEQLALDAALGRILAADQQSAIQAPPADNSAMDGYALRTADLSPEGPNRLPVSQRIIAGGVGEPLQPGSAARIFTGAPVPPGADAVVMQEQTERDGDIVEIRAEVSPGQNIRRAGEDIDVGQTILEAGCRLRPQELGLAATAGIGELPVFRRVRVAIFSTGDELLEPGEPLTPGKIYNSNRYMLLGLLRALQCDIIDLGVLPDTLDSTLDAMRQAAGQADLIVTTGGVSVGEEDHVRAAVEQLGELSLWRINIKPGKPLAFGSVQGAHFIGLPGNPVSAFVTFLLFARPFILKLQGASALTPPEFTVIARFDWPRAGSRQEYLRARYLPDGSGVEIYPHQGSGVLTSTVWADGLVVVPPKRVIKAGDRVGFIPFSELL
ncbi:MAG TPA: molybdopterin molybdenumtransferase MoeA [Gammaproteobacteria bacterium]|nr:molybdopterin molybdenumtransferase MoeA [Gammaproteobacteria bacterium]